MNRRYAVIALALVLLISGSANKCPGGGGATCNDVVFDGATITRETVVDGSIFPPSVTLTDTLEWTTSGFDGDVTFAVYGSLTEGGAETPIDVNITGSGAGTTVWSTTITYDYYRIAVLCDGSETASIDVSVFD
mgnify:CR=1 FL=1